MAGDPLTLSCEYDLSSSVDASVATEVIWMVNGSAVAGDGRISASRSSLAFSPLTTSDTGRYVCLINSQDVYITIQGGQKKSEEFQLSTESKPYLQVLSVNNLSLSISPST